MIAKELEHEINEKLQTYWLPEPPYPCHSNRASSMGHECVRYLTYERVAWDKKVPIKSDVVRVMQEGNLHEQAVMEIIRKLGYQVIEQQRAFNWQKFQITGHVDGKIYYEGKRIPLEVKSMGRNMYGIARKEMSNGKVQNKWLRKYLCQINLYMMMDNIDEAIFIFKNRDNGEIFASGVVLDYELSESLLKKAETINYHVEKGIIPDGINDIDICIDCGYAHICNPEVLASQNAEFDMQKLIELERLIDQRKELEASIKDIQDAIEDLKEKEKELIGESEYIPLGKYIIKGKWVEMPERVVKASKYFRYWIKEK